jgi:hypothetical protein
VLDVFPEATDNQVINAALQLKHSAYERTR